MWHGYFVAERGTIGIDNWNQLLTTFAEMGTHDNTMPAYNTHSRTRLDGDAIIYESDFEPGEVSIAQFKQLLADEFGVPIEQIDDNQGVVSYSSGNDTAVWEFLYNAIIRFTVRRFGRGGNWNVSGDECRGYLSLYHQEWE